MSELIEAFVAQAPEQIAALEAALEQRRADDVRREAHTLKSNAASFGAMALADLCRRLEAEAKAGAIDDGRGLFDRIAAELFRATEELHAIRSELDG